jgi:hypothetical protein
MKYVLPQCSEGKNRLCNYNLKEETEVVWKLYWRLKILVGLKDQFVRSHLNTGYDYVKRDFLLFTNTRGLLANTINRKWLQNWKLQLILRKDGRQ